MPKIYNSGRLFRNDIQPAIVAEETLKKPVCLSGKKPARLSEKNVKFLKSLGYKVRENGHFKHTSENFG